MERTKCQVCERNIAVDVIPYWKVAQFGVGTDGIWYVCSPSCLVELAWGLKEEQVKLSKSGSKLKKEDKE